MKRCNSCTPDINRIIDVSGLDPQPYDDAAVLWALDACGNPIVVEPPEAQISELDREKLDSIIIDGDGNKYLADDGSYKEIVTDNVSRIVLIYDDNPTNFVLANIDGIRKIVELLDGGYSPQVYIAFTNYTLEVNIGYSDNMLQFLFDAWIIDIPSFVRVKVSRQKFAILISLNTSTPNPTVNHFEVGPYTDNSDYIVIDGAGDLFLANDGTYKKALDMDDINAILANYYTKTESNGLFLTKNEFSTEIDNYYTKQDTNDLIDEATEDVVKYDPSGNGFTWPVNLRGDIILKNDMNLFGTTRSGSVINIAEVSRFNTDTGLAIVYLGSTSAHINLNAYDRPTVQHTDNTVNDIAYLEDVEALATDINGQIISLGNRITTVEGDIVTTNNRITNLSDATDLAITNINNEITDIDQRVTTNTTNIATNRTDIDSILQLIEDRNHFQGYYQTTQEILDLQNLIAGDYAWSAESNSVWSYDGTAWADTGNPIPNEATPGSDLIPLVDSGTGSAGVLSEYARGDHRHPSDTTKADVTVLDNYLPLAGNTQLTGMTGDIWIGGNALRLTDSGNTYIGQDSATETTQIVSTGTGGVDILTNAGTVKVNGQRVVVNGNNGDSLTITANNQIGFNVGGSAGGSLSVASTGIVVGGNLFNVQANSNVTLQSGSGDIALIPLTGKAYYGQTNIPGNEIAKISDVEAATGSISKNLSDYNNNVPFAEVSQLPERYQLPADESTVTRTSTDVQIDSKKAELINGEYVISDENIIVPSADSTHAGAYPADHYNIVQGISSTYVSNDSLNNTLQGYDKSTVVDQKIADAIGAIPGVTIIDDLNSTDGTVALSANQGRILDGKITNLQDQATALDIKTNYVDSDSIGVDTTNKQFNLLVASSDELITISPAGVKVNISLVTEGSDAVLYGRDDDQGYPIELGRVNISVGAIESGYYDQATQEIVIVLTTGDEIRIPAADLINVYTGSTYINIDNNNVISLEYDLLSDQLVNDGFLKGADLDNYLPLSGGTMTGEIRSSSIIPTAPNVFALGTDEYPFGGVVSSFASVQNIFIGGLNKTDHIKALDISGDGNSYLANDGTYKTISGGGSGDAIPLAGTEDGKPVTGNIAFDNGAGITFNDTSYIMPNGTGLGYIGTYEKMIGSGAFNLLYANVIGTAVNPVLSLNTNSISVNGVSRTAEISNLDASGSGNLFLANDGIYKEVSGGSGDISFISVNAPSIELTSTPQIVGSNIGMDSKAGSNVMTVTMRFSAAVSAVLTALTSAACFANCSMQIRDGYGNTYHNVPFLVKRNGRSLADFDTITFTFGFVTESATPIYVYLASTENDVYLESIHTIML